MYTVNLLGLVCATQTESKGKFVSYANTKYNSWSLCYQSRWVLGQFSVYIVKLLFGLVFKIASAVLGD